MKNSTLFFWSIIFLTCIASCREDLIPIEKEENKFTLTEINIESSILGQIIDEDNTPIEGASVKVGTEQTSTDENGFFKFANKIMNQSGTLIRAEKLGYFLSVKLVNPNLDKESFVAIQMLKKEITGDFVASSGGEVSTIDKAKVNFQANGIMYEDGTAYNGQVNVYAKWIDPTHELVAERMPGDLRAINEAGELVQLGTYGMVVVELESTSGAKLQLKTGTKATLTMPVPAALLSSAPATIPLWSLDKSTGYWMEESTATLIGNEYVGDVPHFSFWNCDAPFPVVEFETQILDNNGNGVNWLKVAIQYGNVPVRYGYTDTEGYVGGKIPANQILTITVYDQCNAEIYSAQIGPYSSDVVLPAITITTLDPTTISGSLEKCDGSAVTNGYASLGGGVFNTFATVDATGAFVFSSFMCASSEVEIKGYDLDGPFASTPIIVTLGTSGNVNLGSISVCNAITEYIRVEIPDFSIDYYIFEYEAYGSSIDTLYNDITTIIAETDSAYLYLAIKVPYGQVGLYPTYDFGYLDNFNTYENIFFCQNTCPNTDVFTNNGSGGFFDAIFSGIIGSEGTPGEIPITVTLKVQLQ